MSLSIADLREEEQELTERLGKVKTAITAFQDVCLHDWQPNGHDSHYHYDKCVTCGKTRTH